MRNYILRALFNLKVQRAVSSAGRALALQARGHRFDPCTAHHLISLTILSITTILSPEGRRHTVKTLDTGPLKLTVFCLQASVL